MIIQETKIKSQLWDLPPFVFGTEIGLDKYQIATILNIEIVGMNFRSQLKDKNQIQDIFNVTQGIFFSYYYSVSDFTKKMVCRDVFEVTEIDEFDQIRVRLIDKYFEYSGQCIPIRNHLYYMLEKDSGMDEIAVYCTNLPNSHNNNQFGIILCSSVSLIQHQSHFFPAASKVYFSFLGRTFEDVSEKLGEQISCFEDMKKFASYIDEADVSTFGPTTLDDIRNINRNINNLITEDKVPFALVVDE